MPYLPSSPWLARADAAELTKTTPKQFSDLSVDIKTLIVEHIARPTDLVRVCLTCKQLHEIAVRFLYNCVGLDVGSSMISELSAFLNPRNIGLPFIRKLDLYQSDMDSCCIQVQQARAQQAKFAIRMILELLPENILEDLCWHPWSEFSTDNLLLLFRKQKRLQWAECMLTDRDILPEIEKLPDFETMFSNITKVGLYPNRTRVLDYCGAVMKRAPKVERLILHAIFDDSDEPVTSRELNDSSTGPGLITTSIFGHMRPFAKCTPLALTDVTLQKIHLRYAAETYCKFIDFGTVQELRVFSCSGADAFLAELSKSTKLPQKLRVLEFKHEDNAEEDALNALDGFLCLVTGIEILTIDIQGVKSLPASAGIKRHSKTLDQLTVHASRNSHPGDEEEHVYEYTSFQDICKCSQLEQLSIGFPATSLVRDTTDSFKDWVIYEQLLAGLAQFIFKGHSKLAVIAFGTSDKVYGREDSKNQVIFVRGKQVDPLRNESVCAIQIGWCLRRYVEPRSEVLDFELSRISRPPTRDSPASDDIIVLPLPPVPTF
ncbi:hypothetical protein H2199_001000 [Coniosporium tulheliwenetii]|uniref:Uncharacterized protein n=1 Tax=Coniosporium tulheliwenetii TaxID=3383036 RepID=A0ACC2ZNH7_9PEZI|nr:hypothetical protein H2199_001000 [Cladosporium sp. JES 115]